MDDLISPDALKTRFQDEYTSIKAYVELLARRFSVYATDLDRVIDDLVMFGILPREQRLPRPNWPQPYSVSELNTINTSLTNVKQDIEGLFDTWRSQVEEMQNDEAFASIPVHSYEREVVEYFVEAFDHSADVTEDDKENWFRELQSQVQEDIAEYGEESEYYGRDVEPILTGAYKYALYVHRSNITRRLEVALQTIDELDVISQTAQPGNMLNIYRQAFISLMTAFDATAFDLMRLALRWGFFRLIGAFGKKETLSLRDLSNYQSFEQLRDSVIEEQLKTRYLKDILLFLDNQGVDCVDRSSGSTLGHLIELVLRRNVHMHNRGIVDRRYLETKEDGTPRFNIYGLSEGDTAEIDNVYWFGACQLCLECVDRLVAWVQGFIPQPQNALVGD